MPRQQLLSCTLCETASIASCKCIGPPTFVRTSHTLAAIADGTSVPPEIAAGPSSAS